MIKTSQLIKRVSTAESELEILRGIDLEIKRGETAAIVGASGSGKSTLLGLLAGLDAPSSGEITLDGTNIVNLDEDERATLRSEKVGFVSRIFSYSRRSRHWRTSCCRLSWLGSTVRARNRRSFCHVWAWQSVSIITRERCRVVNSNVWPLRAPLRRNPHLVCR